MKPSLSSDLPKLEIILSIVSPLGTKKELFEELLENQLKYNNIILTKISVTNELIDIPKKIKIPKSFEYFLKMQICSELRLKYSNGIITNTILSAIKKRRKKYKKKQTVIYLIDQLKNVEEYKVLNHIYGLNYVQLSLFSKETERDQALKERFESDSTLEKSNDEDTLLKLVMKNVKIKGKPIKDFFKKTTIKKWIDDYFKKILPDSTHRLILKDFMEIDLDLLDKKSGQQVADLFHRSHYFLNLNLLRDNLDEEIKKFIYLLIGKNKEYPTQDEFGMCLAHQVSVRSNFPGGRHIGATILSEHGEVISVASIRAPAKSSNPTLHDENKVQPGYAKYKDKIQSWGKFIKNLTDEDNKRKKLNGDEKNKLKEIDKFIKDILDFHPCTHAEISAIIDAAKVGVSIRNSTLYTTTFPCHLCAKDIINAGIDRVVYLEAYPKSKNKELYPNLIDFENNNLTSEKTSFEFYCGISPKRFLYAYSLENKAEKKEIPLLQFEVPKYYLAREDDVLSHFKNILEKKECKKTIHLCKLLHHKK